MLDCTKEETIRGVAFKLFLEKGYEATSVRSICKSAGIEQPTLYYFFGSKKGLFFAVADALYEEFGKYGYAHAGTIEKPDEALCHIFMESMRFTLEHTEQVRFYLRFTLFPPEELKAEIAVRLEGIRARKQEIIRGLVEACIGQGLIQINAEKAITVFQRFIDSNMLDIVLGSWQPDEDELKELWQMFVKCRLNGEH